MTERAHYLDLLRSTNSRQQRDRLMNQFLSKLEKRTTGGGNRSQMGSVLGSVIGRGESRLGIISEHESYFNHNYKDHVSQAKDTSMIMPEIERLELNKSNLKRLDESQTTKNKDPHLPLVE